ncbi:MAG: regulatory protein RecX [Gammaproteobacteria bacterium]
MCQTTQKKRKRLLKSKPKPGRDAYYVAVNLLSRREHSRVELEVKLAKKEFTQEQIASAFEQLLEHGLQSDQRYLEDFVRSRLLKGSGPLKIAHELRTRGIDSETLQNYLNSQQIDWFEVAMTTYEKKYQPNDEIDARERAKRVRFMQSRGFPSDIIFRLFK